MTFVAIGALRVNSACWVNQPFKNTISVNIFVSPDLGSNCKAVSCF